MSLEEKRRAARALFDGMFIRVPQGVQWMETCGFKFEPRTNADVASAPYLGAGVGLFLLWTLLHHVLRRARSIAVYLPYAAIAGIFALWVDAGAGLAWRYMGDLTPFVVLIGVQYVQSLSRAASSLFGWPLAAVLAAGAFTSVKRDIEPSKHQWDSFDASRIPHMWQDFEATRTGQDKSLPTTVRCEAVPPWPHFDVFWRTNPLSWSRDCTVGQVTELFVGVPPKQDDAYVIRFETEGMSPRSVPFWINGRKYTAQKVGNTYAADVHIHYASLTSPNVLVSVEWIHELKAGDGKLLAVSLQ